MTPAGGFPWGPQERVGRLGRWWLGGVGFSLALSPLLVLRPPAVWLPHWTQSRRCDLEDLPGVLTCLLLPHMHPGLGPARHPPAALGVCAQAPSPSTLEPLGSVPSSVGLRRRAAGTCPPPQPPFLSFLSAPTNFPPASTSAHIRPIFRDTTCLTSSCFSSRPAPSPALQGRVSEVSVLAASWLHRPFILHLPLCGLLPPQPTKSSLTCVSPDLVDK